MTTLATLKAEIADDLARSDLTTAIAEAITEAIEFYQPQPFWFTEDRDATFATVSGTSEYTSTEDSDIGQFYRLDNVFLVDGSQIYDMREISIGMWQDYQDVSTNARPYNFARYQESYFLYPTPDAAYTVRLVGHRKIAAPASDEEADNVWMTKAYQLIRARAVKNIFGKKIRAYNHAQVWQMEEERQLDRLYEESARRTSTGKIKATWF
jgi:hypothetical protein